MERRVRPHTTTGRSARVAAVAAALLACGCSSEPVGLGSAPAPEAAPLVPTGTPDAPAAFACPLNIEDVRRITGTTDISGGIYTTSCNFENSDPVGDPYGRLLIDVSTDDIRRSFDDLTEQIMDYTRSTDECEILPDTTIGGRSSLSTRCTFPQSSELTTVVESGNGGGTPIFVQAGARRETPIEELSRISEAIAQAVARQ